MGYEEKNHTCEPFAAVSAHDKIWSFDVGGWWLSLDSSCCTILIKYCPFCGIKLEDGKELNTDEEGTTHRP